MALFGEYAWDGWAALPYSLVYNGCYIFAEAALTVLVFIDSGSLQSDEESEDNSGQLINRIELKIKMS